MNRRAFFSAAAATALAPFVPALAAPLPVLPGNRRSLILTVTSSPTIRRGPLGAIVQSHETLVVYQDGVIEKITDPGVERMVYERFHRQMRDHGYPATNCPYIPAETLGL